MKYNYIAIQIKEDNKYYAYAAKVAENYNLLSALAIKNIYTANICRTGKACRELVEVWNNCFKKNGTYLFDSPSF